MGTLIPAKAEPIAAERVAYTCGRFIRFTVAWKPRRCPGFQRLAASMKENGDGAPAVVPFMALCDLFAKTGLSPIEGGEDG